MCIRVPYGLLLRWATIYVFALCVTNATNTFAESWGRFRGPNGTGIAENTGTLPVTWSNEKTLSGRLLSLEDRAVQFL
jgi:hypothetical protein